MHASAASHYPGRVFIFQENRFIEELIRHANTSSKLAELSLVCALDICKAAAYLQGEDDLPLRSVAFDIAHEIKVSLLSAILGTGYNYCLLQECALEELYAEALLGLWRRN